MLGKILPIQATALLSILVFLPGASQASIEQTPLSYVNMQAPKGGALHLSTLKKPTSFLPYNIGGESAEGCNLLFATLMQTPLTNLSEQYPYLASQKIVTKDASAVTFILYKNATFEDDTPITAKDVLFSFELIRAQSPTESFFLDNVKSVSVLSPTKIKFTLKFPSRSFIRRLGTLPIFSQKHYKGHALKEKIHVPLSSGPYKVASFESPNFTKYTRNKKWWGASLKTTKGLYNFDTIKYTYYASNISAFEAFKKGEIDWWVDERISNWMQNYTFPAVKKGDVKRIEFEKPFPHGLTALFINSRRWPYDNIKARQALSLLFDFDWLNKALFHNTYIRYKSIFTDSSYGQKCDLTAKKQKTSTLREKRKEALRLLKEAGFTPDKKTKKLLHHNKPFVLQLIVFAPGHRKVFQNYIKTLQDIGIDASIISVDPASYTKKCEDFDFDLILHYYPPILKPGEEQINLWSSTTASIKGSPNLSGVESTCVDDLVEKIGKNPPEKLLKTQACQLSNFILSHYYLIPLWAPKYKHIAFWKHLEHPTPKKKRDLSAALFSYTTWWSKK